MARRLGLPAAQRSPPRRQRPEGGGGDEGGGAPKAFLERLLPSGLAVYVRTLKDRTTFERLLGEVFAETEPGELGNVDDTLVEAGHATRPERR